MKKTFFIFLVLSMILYTSGALADVLSDGWKDATDAELEAAVAEINAEMQGRKATRTDASSGETISGHGTSIEQITVSTAPARIILTCEDKMTSTPATITGGSRELELNPYRTGVAVGLMPETGTFTALVETSGDWSITVEPLASVGAFTAFSGACSAFTDTFTLAGPTIATLATETVEDGLGSFIVELWYQSAWGWDYAYESTLIADFVKGEPYSYDMILKPVDGATAYAIRVYSNYDGLNWTITAK